MKDAIICSSSLKNRRNVAGWVKEAHFNKRFSICWQDAINLNFKFQRLHFLLHLLSRDVCCWEFKSAKNKITNFMLWIKTCLMNIYNKWKPFLYFCNEILRCLTLSILIEIWLDRPSSNGKMRIFLSDANLFWLILFLLI
jgi:hypothetical protein